jgi:hypothetical protein
MTPNLIKTWEERLTFADRVWEAKGLKGGEGSPQYAKDAMMAYRNETLPDENWGNLGEDAVIRVPITFSSMNTMEAQLISREPQMSLFARNMESADAAPIVETLVNYYIYEQRMMRQWKRALKDANIVGGFGVVWHGYTPLIRKLKMDEKGDPKRLIEYYDPARPDAPWLRRIPPWDVRIDPTQSSFHPDEDAAWAARRYLLSPEQFADDPMFARIKVEPTHMLEIRGMRPHVKLAGQEGPDFPKRIEVWEVYDKVNEIMFHLSPGAQGKLLTRNGEQSWPDGVPKEGLPFSYLAFNEQPDDPFPIAYENMIRQQQVELNKCRTMMAELVKRLRRVVLYRKAGLGEGEAERIVEELNLSEWLEVAGGDLNQAVKEIAIGIFPQELIMYEARIVDTIREILGQSRFQRAQRENVESAEEAARIGHGDDTQVGRNQSVMEEFITDSVRKWFQGFRAIATDDVLIPLMTEEDAAMFEAMVLNVTPRQIQGEFMFKMRLGSSRPNNEMREKQEAIGHLQAMAPFAQVISQPQLLIDYWRAFNRSPRRYLLPQNMRQGTGAAVSRGDGRDRGAGGSPRPMDIANITRNVGGNIT